MGLFTKEMVNMRIAKNQSRNFVFELLPKRPVLKTITMKIEVWSDIACPFCYIGKRRLEESLSAFPGANDVTVEYKSFLLNPAQVTDSSVSMAEYLAKEKGISVAQAKEMFQQVTANGSTVNIAFDFDAIIPANTYKAHQLLQFAADKNLQKQVLEGLYKAYFIDGKNVDDEKVLASIAEEQGISALEVENIFNSNTLNTRIQKDIKEAAEFGISGVPFFIFNRKYAISGAQSKEVFTQVLQKVAEEEKQAVNLNIIEGEACSTGGNCN